MAQTPLASLTLPSSTRASELEERLAATRRLAWIGVIAWSLFVVTDFADAAISHRPHILIPLLELRGAGIAVDDVRRGWLSPEPATLLAYGMVQIIAGVAIGSAGSHMVWRARRQVHEARKLGSYRLKARIGSGTTGDVWLARQDPLGRDVALKVLKTPGLGDEESRRGAFASARDLEDALRACGDHEGEDSRRRSGATSRRLAQPHA